MKLRRAEIQLELEDVANAMKERMKGPNLKQPRFDRRHYVLVHVTALNFGPMPELGPVFIVFATSFLSPDSSQAAAIMYSSLNAAGLFQICLLVPSTQS